MVLASEIREGELAVEMPPARDPGGVHLGGIRTPGPLASLVPAQGRHDGPAAGSIVKPWVAGAEGSRFLLQSRMIYWLHLSRPTCAAKSEKQPDQRATFSLRSPQRPNPLGTSIVQAGRLEGEQVLVRGRLLSRQRDRWSI